MDHSITSPATIAAGNRRLMHSIAFAETASSVVSIGAVIGVMHHPGLVAPLQAFVEKHIVKPILQHTESKDMPPDALDAKAHENASLLTKGGVMVATGFALHLPVQLAMNGGFHVQELKQAALGKTLGMTTAIAGMGMLNHGAPQVMQRAEHAVCNTMLPMLPKEEEKGRKSPMEICKLALLEVPSSLVSGAINYRISRGI